MEPNYYFMGMSLEQTSQCNVSAEPPAFDSTAEENANENKNCIECNISTTKQCQTCDVAYCRKCFGKTYSEGKVMRKHIFTDLEKTSRDKVKYNCQLHGNLPFVNFCNLCRNELCVTCTKGHDKKHTIKSIKLMVSSLIELRVYSQKKIRKSPPWRIDPILNTPLVFKFEIICANTTIFYESNG